MSTGDDERVVITGIGMVSPLGWGREQSWAGIRAGHSATRRCPELAAVSAEQPLPAPGEGLPLGCDLGAPVPAHNGAVITGEPVIDYALFAAEEAVRDAGLEITDQNREHIGCVVGTSKGGLRSFAANFRALRTSGERDGSRDAAEKGAETSWWPSSPSTWVARQHQLQGPVGCPVAACATGLLCLAQGAEWVRRGTCDVVLAGSADASLVPIVLGSYRRLGVLARGEGDPATACRPFDRTRSGFVIGEGGAMMVLEKLSHALARRAPIYAEWLGASSAADPSHLTALEDPPVSLTRLIREVLAVAQVRPEELDYLNLHGTATPQNDVYETRALQAALGAAAGSRSCSSLKGALGHLLGAAGSVETALTLLALRDGIVPPTINLCDPDPRCPLDYTPRIAQQKSLTTALKLSLGFGGHLVAAVFRRM